MIDVRYKFIYLFQQRLFLLLGAFASVQLLGAVDVQPLNVALGNSSVTAGGTLSVSWQIKNNGTNAAGSSNSQVRITSSNASNGYGNSGNNVGAAQATGTIAAGGTVSQSTSVTVPTTPGIYYVWVVADNNSALAQSNTTNDFAVSSALTVTAPGIIDVQPQNVTLGSNSVTAGGTLSVSWQIKNNGSAAAASSNTQVRITTSNATNGYGNSGNNVSSAQATGTIAAGGTINQSTSVTVPSTPGIYYIWVVADNNSALAQTNTTNDFAVSSALTVTASGTVDVQPLNVTLGSSSVAAGGTLSVSWQVKNNGTAPAASSNSQVRITTSNAAIGYGSAASNVGSAQPTGAIAAGGTIDQGTTVTVPSAPGSYYVWVIADNNSALAQTSTTNDFAVSVAFTVSAGAGSPTINSIAPDPLVYSSNADTITINGNNFVSGCSVTLWDVTNNQGPYVKTTTFVSSGQIKVAANFTNNTATWSAQVSSPVASNTVQFHVQATIPTGAWGKVIGSFNGVTNYSNAADGKPDSQPHNYSTGINTGMEWECVEYVNRYYWQVYRLDLRKLAVPGDPVGGINASQFFGKASQLGLGATANGEKSAPAVGDILCFSGGTSGNGHVCIVRSVDAARSKIWVIQQNVLNGNASSVDGTTDDNFSFPYTVNNGQYTIDGSRLGAGYACQGWLRTNVPSVTLGVDVSKYNGTVDWAQVSAAGKAFAFLRATAGKNTTDETFAQNATGAKNAGLLVGAYHFAYPQYFTAHEEAQKFLSIAKDYIGAGYLPPVLDIEDSLSENSTPFLLGADTLSQWIRDWCAEVEKATGVPGRKVIVYTFRWYPRNGYLQTDLKEHPLWIATYPSTPADDVGSVMPWTSWTFQQYRTDPTTQGTSAEQGGTCPGITGGTGYADLDAFNGDLAALRLFAQGAANQAPTASFTLSTERGLGQTITITGTVNDPDGNLAYADLWVNTPRRGWLAIKADGTTTATSSVGAAHATTTSAGTFTRSFTFTSADGVGGYQFVLAAVDMATTTTFSPSQYITVVPANQAPTASLTLSSERSVGQTITITGTVNDADGNFAFADLWVNTPNRGWFAIKADGTTTATSSVGPAHATATSTGVFTRSFTFSAADGVGSYQFVLAAVDAAGVTTFTPSQYVTIAAANRAPTASFTLSNERTVGQTITITGTVDDADGNLAYADLWVKTPGRGWLAIKADSTTIATSAVASAHAAASSAGTFTRSFTFTNADGAGSFQFALAAVDAAGGMTFASSQFVTVVAANQAPTASFSLSNERTVGQSITITGTINDADGNLSYADLWVKTPGRGWLAIKADGTTIATSSVGASHATATNVGTFTRSFTFTNADGAGSYQFVLAAVDAAGATTFAAIQYITIVSANQPPTASFSLSGERTVGQAITITGAVNDADGNLAYADLWVKTPGRGWLAIKADGTTTSTSSVGAAHATATSAGTFTRAFTFTNADGAGSYQFVLAAVDAVGATAFTTSQYITVASANQAPTANFTLSNERTVGQTITITGTVNDADGNLAYANLWVRTPGRGWMALKADGTTAASSSTDAANATTTSAGTFTRTFTFTNADGAGNYQFALAAVDSAGLITFAADPAFLTFVPSQYITVVAANQSPTASFTLSSERAVGQTITITGTVNDVDGNLAYVDLWVKSPGRGWLAIKADGSTTATSSLGAVHATATSGGAFSRTFSFSSADGAGSYQFVLAAVDTTGATTFAPSQYISVVATNQAPTASFSLSSERTLGQTITITGTVDDSDGNLAYADLWVNTPGRGWIAIKADSSTVNASALSVANATVTAAGTFTRTFTFTNADGIGSYMFALAAVDAAGATTFAANQYIAVAAAVNHAPTASLTLSSERNLGQTITITGTVNDADNNFAYANLWVNTPGRGWLAIKADSTTATSSSISVINATTTVAGTFSRTFMFTNLDSTGTYLFALAAVDAAGAMSFATNQYVSVTGVVVQPAVASKAFASVDLPEIPTLYYGESPYPLPPISAQEEPLSYSVLSGPVSLEGSALRLNGAGSATLRVSTLSGTATTRSFEVVGSFETWRLARFDQAQCADPLISSPQAVLSPDGLTNLEKYLQGLTPGADDRPSLPTLSRSDCGWCFTFQRAANLPDVRCWVEVTQDGSDWTIVSPILVSGEAGTEHWQVVYPTRDGASPQFRLRVEHVP